MVIKLCAVFYEAVVINTKIAVCLKRTLTLIHVQLAAALTFAMEAMGYYVFKTQDHPFP